ncbi:hypothetical protein E4T66_02460 [Sinimarinibacterium sp. CAU 1509]|uniref:hypothetical protein n=1 Tax=Sinimarinibacterium sp. CAU 1509 TaxID=2562283 RepID=UPI0010AB79F2|nr:hypothetical protein [Sinimarinibacterium sp. CAU 1509]TJY65107.1 hypothetical protein E4T66_02460 [Sinimarinibacterium sp. CAU 1509]
MTTRRIGLLSAWVSAFLQFGASQGLIEQGENPAIIWSFAGLTVVAAACLTKTRRRFYEARLFFLISASMLLLEALIAFGKWISVGQEIAAFIPLLISSVIAAIFAIVLIFSVRASEMASYASDGAMLGTLRGWLYIVLAVIAGMFLNGIVTAAISLLRV